MRASAYERAKNNDKLGAALAGAGALGSALSMSPATAAVGVPMSVGSGAALMLADRIRNRLAEDAKNPELNRPVTDAEIEAAMKPAFVYPKASRRKAKAE